MSERKQHKVVMLPRSLLIAWLISYIVLFIAVAGSFQYANYVDRRSNRYWCNIVHVFNETYKKSPPPTDIGKILEGEFQRLESVFRCN